MSLPPFQMVAAFERSRGLGNKGELPWNLPVDLKHFARTTKTTRDPNKENAVIMGRVTAETIPEKYWPLPKRKNYVITRKKNYQLPGSSTHASLEDAIESAAKECETIFVVGGGEIYSLGIQLPSCEQLVLTRIDRDYECDAFFPEYRSNFVCKEVIDSGTNEGISYSIENWQRRR